MSPAHGSRQPGRSDEQVSAHLFAALGDATRLGLLTRLGRHGPMSITGLTAGANVTRQAIAKHLNVLERAGLVHGHRRGRERLWEVEPGRLDVARRYLDFVSKRWDETLERVRAAVEDD